MLFYPDPDPTRPLDCVCAGPDHTTRNPPGSSAILARMVKSLRIGGSVFLLLLSMAVHAQDVRPLEDLDRTIDQLRFNAPTRIEGRLLTFDTYDEAIWLELTRIYEESRWHSVLHTVQLLVYPRDTGMMEFFRKLPKGTTIRMTIRRDEVGKRRILELEGV